MRNLRIRTPAWALLLTFTLLATSTTSSQSLHTHNPLSPFHQPNISARQSPAPPGSFNATPLDPGFPFTGILNLTTSLPSHSWEYGTAITALLELYTLSASPFTAPSLFPAPSLPVASTPALQYARQHINLGGGGGIDALSPADGAVGDPASLGIGAILLGAGDWNGVESVTDGGVDLKGRYWDAAGAQVNYVLQGAPRFRNGAISHRVEGPELWADFMSMVPPFLAYFGVATGNGTLLQESVRQCALYRDILQDDGGRGLWKHIVGPYNADEGRWSSGNGWAASGMARVLGVVMRAPGEMFQGVQGSSNADEDGRVMKRSKGKCRLSKRGNKTGAGLFGKRDKSWWDKAVEVPWIQRYKEGSVHRRAPDDTNDADYNAWLAHSPNSRPRSRGQLVSILTAFIREILEAVVDTASLDSGLVRNYIDDTSNADGRGFGEVSGTALLASVMYRMAVVDPGTFGRKYIQWAEDVRRTLGRRVDEDEDGDSDSDDEGGYVHVRENGTVVPTVNPYGWTDTRPWVTGSPEAQAFVVMMYAAWRDCVGVGVCERP